MMSKPLNNAFTVDVEDYYHVSGFERHIARDRWDDYPSRVVANTRRMLDSSAALCAGHVFCVGLGGGPLPATGQRDSGGRA